MSFQDRCKIYKKIEDSRGRPLIVYVTSNRGNAAGMMASDAIPPIIDQILSIPKEQKKIDMLLVSDGGDPIVSWRINSMLRERFDHICILLPYAAYSAATLLALGANEIIMGQFSNLGPVDPQLQYVRRRASEGQADKEEIIRFGSEDLSHFIDFIRKDIGITDQEQMESAFELFCKDVGTVPIGIAKRSSYLAQSLGTKLLQTHMDDHSKVSAIVDALNKSFYHHGYPVGRKEATQIDLPVTEAGEDLELLIWQVWKDFETEMECCAPFDPIQVIHKMPKSSHLFSTVPQLNIPANLPPQVQQQMYQQVLQHSPIVQSPPFNYRLFQAAVESLRLKSHFITQGQLLAVRLPNMSLMINDTKLSQMWESENIISE